MEILRTGMGLDICKTCPIAAADVNFIRRQKLENADGEIVNSDSVDPNSLAIVVTCDVPGILRIISMGHVIMTSTMTGNVKDTGEEVSVIFDTNVTDQCPIPGASGFLWPLVRHDPSETNK